MRRRDHPAPAVATEQAAEEREPQAREPVLASAIGNRALTSLIASGSVSRLPYGIERAAAPRALARDAPGAPAPLPPPPVPATSADSAKVDFPEADKERARKMVIGPLRAAAEKLEAGEKADIGFVLRHLKPVDSAIAGVKFPNDDIAESAYESLDELDAATTILKSLKLDHRHAVAAALKQWSLVKKDLAHAAKEIERDRREAAKSKPPVPERAGIDEDVSALSALSEEVTAVSQDLVKAPHSPDAIKEVEKTAADLFEQFDTVKPPEVIGLVQTAKSTFEQGIATLLPLAEGKEEAIKQAQALITGAANKLAAVLGDTPPAGDPSTADDDPPQQVPTPPAPPAPGGGLPPPPPPPGTLPPPAPPKP